MRAQNELSPYFTEIERRTDRALVGIRSVRRAPKFKGFPAEPRPASVSAVFLLTFLMFIFFLLD